MSKSRLFPAFAVAGALLLAAVAPPAAARELRININADPEMIDPITYGALIAGDVLRNIYQGFTVVGRAGEIAPALALSWTPHPDNLGWRFELRKGVVFHTGRPFGAKDVKATFETLLAPGSRAGLQLQYLQRIEGAKEVASGATKDLVGVKVIDDHTLDVRFTAPDVLFPIYPFMFFDTSIIAEKGPTWFIENSAGTGPFRFIEWRRGHQVRLARHDAYWGGAPKIDGIRYIVVASEESGIAMYQAGELDAFALGSTDGGQRVMRDPTLKAEALTTPLAQITYLGLNQSRYAPFRDKRVREALCIAIDRTAMVRDLFGGLAEPLYGQVSPGIPGYNPDVKKIAFDPERAKRLLAEAGFPNGKGLPPLKLTVVPSNRKEAAFYIQQWKQNLGIDVRPDVRERGSFLRAASAGEVPFFAFGWQAGYPDALYYLSHLWHSKSPFNRARYANPAYDRLIDQAQMTPDDQARYKLYHQAESVLMEDWGACGVFVRTMVVLVKPNVSGIALTPLRFQMFDKVSIQ